VARYRLTHDPLGNPTTVTTTRGSASQAVAYTYDADNRVTAACYAATTCGANPSGKVAYTYDAVGNRLTQTLAGTAGDGTTSYTYDQADQLTKASNSATGSTTGYGYDGEGNLVRSGSDSFRYNLDHTLASATVGSATTSYGYDGQGLRQSAVTDAGADVQSRTFNWDLSGNAPQLALERNARSSAPRTGSTRGYLTSPADEAPLALLTGSQVDAFAPDWLAGVADVLSPQGTALAAYDFDPYGVPRSNGTAASAISKPTVDNPVQFAGGYQDSTLGASYATPARVYDPGTGRFGGTDPAQQATNIPATSSYAYVQDRPVSFRDPSGAKGGNVDHDDAVRLAVSDRLNPLYGPQNVYGDVVPGQMTLPGHVSTGPGGTLCVPTINPSPGDPATSCPDIIALDGARTLLYEVKPASDQLTSIRPQTPQRGIANADQVDRYIRSLAGAGFSQVQAGPAIVPATRTYADGSTLSIFSGVDWGTYAAKGKRPAANSNGVIYYLKKQPPRRVPVPPPAAKPGEEPTNTAKPSQQPHEEPTDQPVISDDGQTILDDVLVGAAIVLAAVIVVALLPEEVVAGAVAAVGAGIGALVSWAF
jgi:RHS repeat-associated protein